LSQPLPLDGRDAWSAITAGAASPHDDILINITATGGAIRMGDWKLVSNGQRADADDVGSAAKSAKKKGGKKKAPAAEVKAAGGIELFNLKADPYEKNNLASAHPDKVKTLRARLDAYAKAAVPSKLAPQSADFKVPAVWGER
jgi:hypothetical protein